jgi:hypothetical protein
VLVKVAYCPLCDRIFSHERTVGSLASAGAGFNPEHVLYCVWLLQSVVVPTIYVYRLHGMGCGAQRLLGTCSVSCASLG